MLIRVFRTSLVLLSLIILSRQTGLHYKPIKVAAVKKTDNSVQFRRYDDEGNYAFGYETQQASATSFHREIGDANGNKAGTYGFTSNGRIRIVNYVADSRGFRATVQSNEPGLAKSPHVALRFPVTLALWLRKNLQYSF